MFRLNHGALVALLACLLVGPLTAAAAELSGRMDRAPTTYDLTANSADWVHFGYIPLELDRKRGVSRQITPYVALGGADPGSTDRVETGYTWSDGLDPVRTMPLTATGNRVFELNRGFRIEVNASTSLRTLTLFLGAWNAEGSVRARLSDNSAAAFETSVRSSNKYGGEMLTIRFRAGSPGTRLIIDYLVTARLASQAYITLESAALDAAGGGGAAMISGSKTASPALNDLTALGPTDWVHYGRIPEQPTDRKAGVVQKISGHIALGNDVSPSAANAASAARWSDGTPNSAANGTASSIRVFDDNKGLAVVIDAGSARQTALVYVGIKGRATARLRATLSDGSAPAYTRTVSQGSGQTTYLFTLNFAANSNNRTLRVAWERTDPRTSASFISLESVKLLGTPETDPGPDPEPEPSEGTGAIGDLVWRDANGDGRQSAGETGLPGVTVALRACRGTTDLRSVTTDGNGNFLFANLPNERFQLRVQVPDGFQISPRAQGNNRQLDSDAFSDGRTGCTRATQGKTKRQFDIGLIPADGGGPGEGEPGGGTSKVGGIVWRDTNADGVRADAEVGIGGVAVELLSCATDAVLASTTTPGSGRYLFSNLMGGEYRVRVTPPAGLRFSPQFVGNASRDSNFRSDGLSNCINVPEGKSRRTVDAGLN